MAMKSLRIFSLCTLVATLCAASRLASAETYNVREFGAKGDGATLDTAPIQKALDACGEAGGGTVRLPAGTYLSKPLTLRTKTTLHLDAGATLKATDERADFQDPNRPKSFVPFIGGKDLEDVTIGGSGVIDGSGGKWWVPAEEARQKKSGYSLPRPRLIVLTRVKNLVVRDVTLQNSPSFHLVPTECDDVLVTNVTFLAPERSPNTDAIDPTLCRRVTITRCLIDVGDDNVAVKSGRKLAGREFACEDLTVTDCTMRHGHGISIGSETVGGVRRVRNCTFVNTDNGLRIKSGRTRGGAVEDVVCEDITMKDVRGAITITSYYPRIPANDTAQAVTDTTPRFRNITIRNLSATSSKYAGFIVGLPESAVENVLLENVSIAAEQTGLEIRNARGVKLKNVKVMAKQGEPFVVKDAEVTGLEPQGAPPNGVSASPGKASAAKEWEQVPASLARIRAPVFPARVFSIANYGAAPDGEADCTAAIARAIEACAQAGGGRVLVPAGEFLTGPVHLRSDMELHLAAGATLKFTMEPKAYLPAVLSRFESIECYNYSPFIYAFGQTNVAVTGEGTLDGQATEENWLRWKGKKGGTPNQATSNERLKKMAEEGVPVEQRRFGEGDYLRPNFIQFNRCCNVMVSGVRIRRSPMWELNPVLCTNVIVRGVDIVSHGANNDGCDPESCRDVLIEDCLFDTGDDCIAIKSGRNGDGRRLGTPSVNLVIRNCTMRDGHAGAAIGSEVSGSCSNVFVEHCEMSSPRLNCALRLKSNAVRGGVIENIFMRDVKVGQVADSVLLIDFLYAEGTNGVHNPVTRNVVVENVTVARTPRVLNIRGFPGAEISNVRILNSTFKQVERSDVIVDADATLVNCEVERKR